MDQTTQRIYGASRLAFRSFTVFRLALLIAAGIALLGFLARPTIEFDEGFFFQSAVQATKNGLPGFPWADIYFGNAVPYIPLNSLVPLVNWPLALSPESVWLVAGRLVSVAAVLGGLSVLFFCGRESPTAGPIAWVVTAFVALCHPLWLHGRTIRPEALVFFTFCLGLVFAQRPGSRSAFLAGVASGLSFLSHAIHGLLICAVILTCAAALAGLTIRQRWGRAALVAIGTILPVAVFYGFYIGALGLTGTARQIELFLSLAPRSVASHLPLENLVAWFTQIRGQLNVIPLLGVATFALLVQLRSNHAKAATNRVFQWSIVVFMVFWILAYPKKALSPVVVLLPLAWSLLGHSAVGGWRGRVIFVGSCTCLLANLGLLARYHSRLACSQSGMEQVAPAAAGLSQAGIIRPGSRVMAKLWLIFGLPREVTVWDVTLFPRVMQQSAGSDAGLRKAMDLSDAVVLEWTTGGWVDEQQAELAAYCRAHQWRESRVRTTRLFTPVELVLFVPAGRKVEKDQSEL